MVRPRGEHRLLLQTFDKYLQEFAEKRVGNDRSAGTLLEYRVRRDRLAAFLQYEYGLSDIPFRKLKREFAEKFIVYLSTVRGASLQYDLPHAKKSACYGLRGPR